MKKETTLKHTGFKTKDLQWKKMQLQNARGSKQKTSDEKRDNPKTQGAQNKRPPMKKETTPKHKGLKIKDLWWKKRQPQNTSGSKQNTSDKKRGNIKTQGAQNIRHPMKKEATEKHMGLKIKDLWWKKRQSPTCRETRKSGIVSSPKPTSLN
jgi:hypothetical protein